MPAKPPSRPRLIQYFIISIDLVPFTSFPPPSSALLLHNAPNTIQATGCYRLRFSKYSFLPFLSAFSPPFLVSNIKCTLKGVWYQLTYNFCQKTFAFNFSKNTGEFSTKILLSNFVIYSAPIFVELFAVFVIFSFDVNTWPSGWPLVTFPLDIVNMMEFWTNILSGN